MMFSFNNYYEKFNNSGYVVVDNLIDKETVDVISRYIENQINQSQDFSSRSKYGWHPGCDDVSSFSCYGDPLIEVLLLKLKPKIESIVNKELEPTYTFSRLYAGSDELKVHTDRESCEYSVTINIANVGNQNPVIMNGQDYVLQPGDGVVYLGCEIPHARKPLNTTNTQMNVQIMLHYVDKNGEFSNYKYDKRSRIGYGASS